MFIKKIAFSISTEVCGDGFFGRKELLRSVITSILARGSVFLVGQRRIGKSSFLCQLAYLKDSGQITFDWLYPIFVRIDGMTLRQENVEHEFINRISYSIFRGTQNVPSNIARTLHTINPYQIRDYLQLMDALERIRKHGLLVVLLFDEFDEAIRSTKGEIARFLRSFISQGHLVAVCTSSCWPHELANSIAPIGSHWFNVFNISELGYFTQLEAFEMLQMLSELTGYKMSDNECSFLCSVLGNHPFYLQLAGYKLFTEHPYSNCSPNKRLEILRETVGKVIDHLWWHFEFLLEHMSNDQLEILKQIAKGKSSFKSTSLQHRLLRTYLNKTDDGYEINCEIFRQFLLQLPDRKDDSSTTVFTRLADFGKKALDVAVRKAIEIAAENYLR